ncbi:MAG TPA: hypothetical protein DDZ82_08720 [Rhodobacteraceae bacterium]|nr:hypothetical protein [Paracoccaceae bacterium]HBM68891.1 hypothetical protein [Paracoccaceae bacterium]
MAPPAFLFACWRLPWQAALFRGVKVTVVISLSSCFSTLSDKDPYLALGFGSRQNFGQRLYEIYSAGQKALFFKPKINVAVAPERALCQNAGNCRMIERQYE